MDLSTIKYLSILLFLFISAQAQSETRKVELNSYQEILQTFEEIGYTSEQWQAGIREVPRIKITEIPKRWQQNAPSIPVKDKKNIFFRLVGPGVLIANEKISAQRKKLLNIIDQGDTDNNPWLRELAVQYKVTSDTNAALSQADIDELKLRVDEIPASLSLAQSAEESGWGTSRFSVEGNALFGQWDFSGNGIKPKQQRKELGNYGIAQFDSPQQSIKAYILNLNTHPAYKKLRHKRAKMRAKQGKPSGWELAKTLDKYSERGTEYVKTLHTIMGQNKLAATDEAKLWDKGLIIVSPGSEH